jgi:hypothetical protein
LIRSSFVSLLSAELALLYFRFVFGVGDACCEYCFHLQTIMTSLDREVLWKLQGFSNDSIWTWRRLPKHRGRDVSHLAHSSWTWKSTP